MRIRLGLCALVALCVCVVRLDAAVKITGVGRVQFSTTNSSISEISGITYVSGNQFYAISDNNSQIYPLNVGINSTTGAMTSLSVGKSIQMRDSKGNALTNTDIEGVAFNPAHNSVYVSDEKGPTIREQSLSTGKNMLTITPSTAPQLNVFKNIKTNAGWETMTRQANGASAWTANEDVLTTDGASTTLTKGGIIRLQKFNSSMAPAGQYAYQFTPNDTASAWTGFGSAHVSDGMVLPDGTLVMLERDTGSKNGTSQVRVALYGIDFTSATNLNGGALTSSTVTVKKNLLWEVLLPSTTNGTNNQFEGMTLGPKLSNGDYSILLAADNQGGSTQAFYALRAAGITTTAALVAADSVSLDGVTVPEPSIVGLVAGASTLLMSRRRNRS